MRVKIMILAFMALALSTRSAPETEGTALPSEPPLPTIVKTEGSGRGMENGGAETKHTRQVPMEVTDKSPTAEAIPMVNIPLYQPLATEGSDLDVMGGGVETEATEELIANSPTVESIPMISVPLAQPIKKEGSDPAVVSGEMDPKLGEQTLEEPINKSSAAESIPIVNAPFAQPLKSEGSDTGMAIHNVETELDGQAPEASINKSPRAETLPIVDTPLAQPLGTTEPLVPEQPNQTDTPVVGQPEDNDNSMYEANIASAEPVMQHPSSVGPPQTEPANDPNLPVPDKSEQGEILDKLEDDEIVAPASEQRNTSDQPAPEGVNKTNDTASEQSDEDDAPNDVEGNEADFPDTVHLDKAEVQPPTPTNPVESPVIETPLASEELAVEQIEEVNASITKEEQIEEISAPEPEDELADLEDDLDAVSSLPVEDIHVETQPEALKQTETAEAVVPDTISTAKPVVEESQQQAQPQPVPITPTAPAADTRETIIKVDIKPATVADANETIIEVEAKPAPAVSANNTIVKEETKPAPVAGAKDTITGEKTKSIPANNTKRTIHKTKKKPVPVEIKADDPKRLPDVELKSNEPSSNQPNQQPNTKMPTAEPKNPPTPKPQSPNLGPVQLHYKYIEVFSKLVAEKSVILFSALQSNRTYAYIAISLLYLILLQSLIKSFFRLFKRTPEPRNGTLDNFQKQVAELKTHINEKLESLRDFDVQFLKEERKQTEEFMDFFEKNVTDVWKEIGHIKQKINDSDTIACSGTNSFTNDLREMDGELDAGKVKDRSREAIGLTREAHEKRVANLPSVKSKLSTNTQPTGFESSRVAKPVHVVQNPLTKVLQPGDGANKRLLPSTMGNPKSSNTNKKEVEADITGGYQEEIDEVLDQEDTAPGFFAKKPLLPNNPPKNIIPSMPRPNQPTRPGIGNLKRPAIPQVKPLATREN